MKLRIALSVVLLAICINIFGQQQKSAPTQKQQIQELTTTISVQQETITNQQEAISQLQAKNEEQLKQLDNMEKEIELYRGDIRTKISELDSFLSNTLTAFSIIAGLVGILLGFISPLVLNEKSEKRINALLDDARKQNKEAVDQIEKLKTEVATIKESINKDATSAKEAAEQANASKLFTEALSITPKDLKKAIELYSQVIEIDPQNHAAYNNRANCKQDLGDYAGCLEDFNKAIELNPSNSMYYFNRGNYRMKTKDYENAIKDYSQAISINPDYAEVYNNRAIAYLEMGKYNKALVDVNIAINKKPHEACFETRGQINMALGNNKEALADFSLAITKDPKFINAYENRAKCYRKLAQAEKDKNKKTDYISEAENDENKAQSLKEDKQKPQ